MNNVIITAVAVCFVSILSGCSEKAEESVEKSAIPVKTVLAETKDFERVLTVQGTIDCKVYANVSARVGGNLDEIFVDEGDVVKAGETVLFQIDPVSLGNKVKVEEQNLLVAKASLGVAEASRDAAEADARKAGRDFERYTRLRSQGNVSENEFESRDVANTRAVSALAVASAQVDLAMHNVRLIEVERDIASKNLSDSRVTAPVSGIVTRRDAEPGEMMAAGKFILRIEDLSTREAVAFLPARYYPDVKEGSTKFRLSVNGIDAGEYTITYRSPTVDTTLRTFEVKGRISGHEDVAVPGDMADLSIVFSRREGVAVPSASVLNRSGENIVFVVSNGKATRRPVKVGLTGDGMTEILEGVLVGEKIVSEGQSLLSDGSSVN